MIALHRLHGEQIRAARALLGWTAADLAERAGVSSPSVRRMDTTVGRVSGDYRKIMLVRKALEAEGIQFLEYSQLSHGIGVSIVKPVTE